LADLDGIARTVATVRPDVIVNAAAYTAVDKAESESEFCHTINTDAVAVLARAASPMGALLVHYSTDYVFNGSGDKPWVETDPTGPLNVYGQSKLDGEKAIERSGCAHLIFRTSWVYGLHGGNFAKTMLRLAQEREQLKVINDQVGAPTSAELIAQVTAQAITATQGNLGLRGLYHLAAARQWEKRWSAPARCFAPSKAHRGVALGLARSGAARSRAKSFGPPPPSGRAHAKPNCPAWREWPAR
jgi:dTDP-4-dehydrorhamnose reductase